MEYTHLSIPRSSDLAPTERMLRDFLTAALEAHLFVDDPEVVLLDYDSPAGHYEGRDPITGQSVRVPIPEAIELSDFDDIVEDASHLTHFDVEVSGEGRPDRLLSVPVGYWEGDRWQMWDESSHLVIGCSVRPDPRSTSDLHEESEVARSVPAFDDPCEAAGGVGLYSHPETLELIEVEGAGCARFWFFARLGRFFPRFEGDRLPAVDPVIDGLLRAAFSSEFVTGCYWG